MKLNLMFPFSILIVILFTSCGANDVTIKTLMGDNVNLSKYQTYYVLPEPPTTDNPNPSLVKSFPRRVCEDAVVRELTIRNYTQVRDIDEADMLVAIQFSLKDEERTYTTTNASYGNNGYGNMGYGNNGYNSNRYGYSSRSGYGYGGYYGYQTFANTSTIVEKYRKGNMIIDLVDKKENVLIWEAFAQGKGETDLDAIEIKVKRVVADIFSKYPLELEEK